MAAAGSWTRSGTCRFRADGSVSSVDHERRSVRDAGQGAGHPQNSGDALFAGHNGGVREHSACFRDDGGGDPEQWRPGGVSGAADQDVAGGQRGEFVDAVNGPGGPTGGARAGADACEKRASGIPAFCSGTGLRGEFHVSPPGPCRACRTADPVAAARPAPSGGPGSGQSGARSAPRPAPGTGVPFPGHPSLPARRTQG